MKKLLIKLVVRMIHKDWGKKCETYDLDDMPDLKPGERCPLCEAHDVAEWLERWGKL